MVTPTSNAHDDRALCAPVDQAVGQPLNNKEKEIRRLRDLIIQIGDVINCDDGGPEQVCHDVWKIIDAEISPPNERPGGSESDL